MAAKPERSKDAQPEPSSGWSTRAYQSQFHQRWNHLNDPHVRALAWLLDAPDLLDPEEPQWQGKVATLGPVSQSTIDWLTTMDGAPQELHDYLQLQSFSRLGRYAERLMAFYLKEKGILVAHGVQVRNNKKETVGEFDFLVRVDDQLLHWEFASKLYLLKAGSVEIQKTDYFVGPNLVDSLGKKIRKIMDQQLSLSLHPAAQGHLPQPVTAAQALVKGWLFYHEQNRAPANPVGVSVAHCSGFWCSISELNAQRGEQYAVLPRLSWLAPAKLAGDMLLDGNALKQRLASQFQHDKMPVLIAVMEKCRNDYAIEIDRGFIVPDDWQARAEMKTGA